MANIGITSDTLLSNVTYSAGDSLDLAGSSTLTIDESSLSLSALYANSGLQRVIFSNNTSNIYILNMNGPLDTEGGTLEFDTNYIELSSPYVVPTDSQGQIPTHIGFFKDSATGEIYHECDSLVGLNADERGLHFTYNSTTGAITVGDGFNGKVPSANIQIPNFYVEMNGNSVEPNTNIVGSGFVTFTDIDYFSTDHFINLEGDTHWAIVNPQRNVRSLNLKKHSYKNMNVINLGSNSELLSLAESSPDDHVIYSSNSASSSERVRNANVPMYGVVEVRHLIQPTSTLQFALTQMYNNGGDFTVVELGGNKVTFELRGGSGGTTRIKWSTGYKRTDNSFRAGIWCRNSGTAGTIIWEDRIGNEPWPSQSRHAVLASSGDLDIRFTSQFPSDANFYEILNLSGDSTGTIDGLVNNGTSARGTRDYNTFAPRGWVISNTKMPNDTSHGCQAQENTEYHHTTMIGTTPNFGRGMVNSEIITNSAGTQGSLWMLPFTTVSGNVIFLGRDSYYSPNAITEQKSAIVTGLGVCSQVVVHGIDTGKFSLEFKLWEIDDQEPSNYLPLTLANVQAEQAGYTFNTRWTLRLRVTKNSDVLDQGILRGVEFQCPFDPTYVWAPPSPLLPIEARNLQDGTRVVVINWTKSQTYTDAYGVERLSLPLVLDNSVVSGGNGYSLSVRTGQGEDVEIGDIILIKANWQSGTQAKIPLRFREEMTSVGISIIDEQEDDEIHNNLVFNGVIGVDGQTVDSSQGGPLSANFTNIEININDADDSFDCRLGIAWWRWINTTEQGALIYDAEGLVYRPDEYNIVVEGPLKIRNAKANSELTIINGIWRHYQGESIVASNSDTIVWVPNDRLYNSNLKQVADIKAAVDQYLNASVLSVKNQTDQMSFTNGSINANATVDLSTVATQASVDMIPTDPLLTTDSRLNNLDSPISSRSTLTAQQVWEYSARTLSSFGSLVSDIWQYATRALSISPPTSEQIADAVWDEVIGPHDHNLARSAGKRLRQAGTQISAEGSVVSGTSSSIVSNLLQTTDSFYSDQTLVFISGDLEGQCRIIESYNGQTKTLVFDEPFSSAPQAGDEFEIKTDHVHTIAQIQQGLATENSVLNNSGKLEELLSNHKNPTYYYGEDGVTRVKQNQAYFISLRTPDGNSEIRRIAVIDENGNPASLQDNGGYQ